jgi:hypothetical protein
MDQLRAEIKVPSFTSSLRPRPFGKLCNSLGQRQHGPAVSLLYCLLVPRFTALLEDTNGSMDQLRAEIKVPSFLALLVTKHEYWFLLSSYQTTNTDDALVLAFIVPKHKY